MFICVHRRLFRYFAINQKKYENIRRPDVHQNAIQSPAALYLTHPILLPHAPTPGGMITTRLQHCARQDAAPLPSYSHNHAWGGGRYFSVSPGKYINTDIKVIPSIGIKICAPIPPLQCIQTPSAALCICVYLRSSAVICILRNLPKKCENIRRPDVHQNAIQISLPVFCLTYRILCPHARLYDTIRLQPCAAS